MVLKLFTWRYGGHQVFVSGSFDRWRERTQLILVEGSGMIFQRIVNLPPGCHQFKYLVDGTWRVDREQLFVEDEYGTVNNIIFVGESECSAPNLPSGLQSIMGSDNSRAMASSSGHPAQRLVMPLPENGVDISRSHLLMHLSSSRAYELIPNSGKVIAVDVEVAVKQAFQIMYEQGVSVLPLWDEHSTQISGMLTASDLIMIIMKLQRMYPLQINKELEMHTVSTWKNGKIQHRRALVGAMMPEFRSNIIQVGPDESLKDMAVRILQNDISAVPIMNSTEDGSGAQLLHVACLAGVLNHICRNFKHRLEYLPLLRQPVGYLPFGSWAGEIGRSTDRVLLTLHADDSLSSALSILLQAHVSSIPIVGDQGTLINIYCRRDITSLAKECLYAQIQPDHTTLCQALEILNESASERVRTCSRSDTLYTVMELLSDPAVRRVIVTDPCNQQVEGIISLRDVFNLILK